MINKLLNIQRIITAPNLYADNGKLATRTDRENILAELREKDKVNLFEHNNKIFVLEAYL